MIERKDEANDMLMLPDVFAVDGFFVLSGTVDDLYVRVQSCKKYEKKMIYIYSRCFKLTRTMEN
jgi:hypothetical protein